MQKVAAYAGVVLAGGRSARMGTPKAALEWHGSTLLRRTVGIMARATGGSVVVVRAPGQDLPELPEGTVVADDPREGRGPVQGIAAGLAALTGRADVAFVSSTDLPFLHPAFIRRVLHALGESEGTDVALPVARGYKQPLAAAYRVSLAGAAERLVREDRLRPAFLFGECQVEMLDETALRRDPVLAALDPDLDSVLNVNTPADYVAARARPAPEVTVQLFGTRTTDGSARGPRVVRAATVGGAADALAVMFDRHVTVTLNGDQITGDRATPLAAGDTVCFGPAAGADA
jgi:molybdenum cofactor guanylyltransferase